MVTAIVGRSFLAYYNQKYHTDLSAKAFFEQVYFPLFYHHTKYMQWLSNSPFVQMKKGQKAHLLNAAERVEKCNDLARKVAEGATDYSVFIGSAASEENKYATTSGQVTDIALLPNEEIIYCSWIGSGFGVGVSGGQTMLFDNPLILDTLFAGWHHYRDFLNDPAYDNLPGNKINTWNGQWLSHALSNEFKEHSPLRGFPAKAFGIEPDKEIEIKTQSWLNVLLGIASQLPVDDLTGYVYKMDKTNSTFGFIPFRLAQLQRPEQVHVRLFGEGEYQNDRDKLRTLYGTARSFQRICEMGAIGVSALEPKGLRDIMQGGKSKPTDAITFKAYITWLLAMLNKDEMWEEAGQAADLLIAYERESSKRKGQKDLNTGRGVQIDQLRNAAGQRAFLNGLVPIMEDATDEVKPKLAAFAKAINAMPSDNFAYYHTLIKLRYAERANLNSTNTSPQLTLS